VIKTKRDNSLVLSQFYKSAKGFTLIEILIGIAIIGILSAVAIPQYNKYKIRGYDAHSKQALKDMHLLCNAYWLDTDSTQGCNLPKIKEATYGFNQDADVVATLPPSPLDNFCASAKHNSSPNTYSIDSASLISDGSNCSGAGGSVQTASVSPAQTFETYKKTQFIDDCNRIVGSRKNPDGSPVKGYFALVESNGSVMHPGAFFGSQMFSSPCSSVVRYDPIPRSSFHNGTMCCKNCFNSKKYKLSTNTIKLSPNIAALMTEIGTEVECKVVFIGAADQMERRVFNLHHQIPKEEWPYMEHNVSMLQYNFETGVWVDNSNGEKYKNGVRVE
jgi:prepilin-type N-terminal cleavage/methylation domain-containing protein